MKTIAIIFLCVFAVLAISEVAQAQNLCDSWGCSMDCFERGLHGECSYDDMCRCGSCIYRACRKLCSQEGRVGQCDNNECLCL